MRLFLRQKTTILLWNILKDFFVQKNNLVKHMYLSFSFLIISFLIKKKYYCFTDRICGQF